MKLKYVSVSRRLGPHRYEGGYLIRGELDEPPAAEWFEQFLLIWENTPVYRSTRSMPWLNKDEIIIPVKESEAILPALETLKSIISGHPIRTASTASAKSLTRQADRP